VRYLLDTCVISEPTKKRPSGKVLTWLDVQEEMSLFLRGYPETFSHRGSEIMQHPCGNETQDDHRDRAC
jgi:hypothetical protein